MSALARRLVTLEGRIRRTRACSTCRGVEHEALALALQEHDGVPFPIARWMSWGDFAAVRPITCPDCGRMLDMERCHASLSLFLDSLPEATLRAIAGSSETSKT